MPESTHTTDTESSGGGERQVTLLGRADESTAFAMVNERWCHELRRLSTAFELHHAQQPEDLAAPLDALIWQDWETDFTEFVAPRHAARVAVVRPWDFGPYPRSWIRHIEDHGFQLWVHSSWIQEQAENAGLAPERIDRIPLGYEPEIFRPDGPRLDLPPARFRFLFVGAAIQRKGLDLLLRAFAEEFAPDEGVCLVVKSRPVDIFYGGLELHDALDRLAEHERAGAFVRIDEHLTTHRLAALYRSCDFGVFPFRAEGFALPVLETMACGLPPVVPRFGACLDYCDEASASFAPHRRIQLPVDREMAYNTLGFRSFVEEVDFCEVRVDGLRATLRRATELSPEELAAKSHAASERVRRFTWTQSAKSVVAATERLLSGTP